MQHEDQDDAEQDFADLETSSAEVDGFEPVEVVAPTLEVEPDVVDVSLEDRGDVLDLAEEENDGDSVKEVELDSPEPVKNVSPLVLQRPGSPAESMLSGPDATPSIQGSILSSPGSSILPSLATRPRIGSPSPSFRPFDRRFASRMISSSNLSPRPSSPAFLGSHSRTTSVSSQLVGFESTETDSSTPPWEVVRWTRLNKLNGQAFSEAGRRNFGSPTCMAVSAHIALGTTKGIILMFDFSQNLKGIIGPGTKAVECGAVTSIAISADHSTIAGGHADGSIFTWEASRAAKPFLSIPHLDPVQMQHRTVDGHIPNVAITHLGFLGSRHTALVSADDRGMAFSHLATRGTGALGRTVKTTRILGRYPDSKPLPSGKALKPSTVLAFASLPLGTAERSADSMGLTAMLTPYLLVIVSTTPVAQTQHKAARPKDVAAHSAMTGCLAWFPAVKLKLPDPKSDNDVSRVKLVYCWSNVLTVLEVNEVPAEEADKPPTLAFRPRSRWKCEESIVAVQWLSRSVLTVLTVSQRLIVLEDYSMRMTEAFDLIGRHIYHKDLFSKQLESLVEHLDEADTSMHGVVADAFHMSFKSYKGRIVLLGFNDVAIGALSNWADRLNALMDAKKHIGAIELVTSYYTGDADKLTVGLPEDAASRHNLVKTKMLEIMSSSLKYILGQHKKATRSDDQLLRTLADRCFTASLAIDDHDFLFDEVYEWYDDADLQSIFLDILEPYILDKTITMIPPGVVKAMVTYYVTNGGESRLEDIICHLNTLTLDLDEITILCKQHGLYEALIYVWNQALSDYITPLIDLLTLLLPLMQNGEYVGSSTVMEEEAYGVNALKIFPYLSYVLSGRIYPTGEPIEPELALRAKSQLYWFLFSGQDVEWPRGSGKHFKTRPDEPYEPPFPYLRMILKFDAPSFLSMLNEAFEDSFINTSHETQASGSVRADMSEEQIFGMTVDRQYIVSILMEIMNVNDFAPVDTIYLDMFVARNLPKYSQYLILPATTLSRVLSGLCHYPGEDLAEDAQLSAEYLLSVFHPPDLAALMPAFKEAGFYRILKSIYRSDKEYPKLVQTYFEDPADQDGVFGCLSEVLRPRAKLSARQTQEVHQVITEHAREIMTLDAGRTATLVTAFAPGLSETMLNAVEDEPRLRFEYLKAALEPQAETWQGDSSLQQDRALVEKYVRLLCRFEPNRVSTYIDTIQAPDLHLEELLPTMHETGVIDAAVMLMSRQGLVQEAMAKLTEHLHTLADALVELSGSNEEFLSSVNHFSAAEDLLKDLQKYTHVGIWLCQGQSKAVRSNKSSQKVSRTDSSDDLSLSEQLWLNLIDATVQVTKQLNPVISGSNRHTDQELSSEPTVDSALGQDEEMLVALLRSLVQHTFTALLALTTSSGTTQSAQSKADNAPSFLRILRVFLTQAAASSPDLADLRAVLSSIFAAYAYEESILRLSSRLLGKSLFVNVRQAVALRQKGWRPRGSTCEACERRVWGPGVLNNVHEAWEEAQGAAETRRAERQARFFRGALTDSVDRGKGKGSSTAQSGDGDGQGPLAVDSGQGKSLSSPDSRAKSPRPQGPTDGDEGTEEAVTDDGLPHAQVMAEGLDAALAQRNENQKMEALVVFACRHVYHRSCIEALQGNIDEERSEGRVGEDEAGYGVRRALRCPIDR